MPISFSELRTEIPPAPEPCRCRSCVRNRLTYGVRVFNAEGYCPDGYDRDGYDSFGEDPDGYDRYGFDAEGYNSGGYNSGGYNRDGYNYDGFDADGYDVDGYDADGYDSDGYDADGYDESNYDRDGDYRYDNESEDQNVGCCDSPQVSFSIRNDGEEPLRNDQRITIELAAGIIDEEGLGGILSYLYRTLPDGDNLLAYELDDLGDQWQTKTGNYAKRLSALAYKTRKIKLAPEVLSQVGNIARDHSEAVNVTIDVTRELNMGASAFYHGDSCWWGSYSESRCALKTNGGFGLRSFNDYGDVSGRVWVMPLRQSEIDGGLTPTFETMEPDAFVLFNGYGALAGYAAPRIIAHMAGWTYRKIGFGCEPMYVNSGGYLVAREEIAERYKGRALSLDLYQHSGLFADEQENQRIVAAAKAAAEMEAADVS